MLGLVDARGQGAIVLGASRGAGRHIAVSVFCEERASHHLPAQVTLAREGYAVAILARDREGLAATAKLCNLHNSQKMSGEV